MRARPAPPPRRLALLGVLLLAALPVRAEEDERLARAEAKQKARIAEIWIDLAEDLAERDLKDQAREAAARARALAPEHEDLAALEERIEDLAGEGEPDAAAERRLKKAYRDAAKGYDKLASLFEEDEEDPRHAAYLFTALTLEPSKRRLAKVANQAKKGLFLVQSPRHPLAAWLSLPKGWKSGREWPVLVSVEGAGCNFRGNANSFRSARGARDWITISPHALSCTNELRPEKYPAYAPDLLSEWDGRRVDFDVAGLLAILDLVREHFGGGERIAITGFSGGGNLCYGFLLRHPERVMAAAPACANFNPGLAQGAADAEDGGPPVHIMTGENDPHRHLTHGTTPPGLEEQTDWAEQALRDRGFRQVRRTMLPGVGHSALPRQVWEFVDEVTESD